jgi:hypothetical protein
MDGPHFDDLLRTVSATASRRGLLAGLASQLLAFLPSALGGDDAEARKKRKKNKKKRRSQPAPVASLPLLSPPPPGGCPLDQKPCDGGCIASSQCCDDTDCPASGQVCTPARQCVCPAGLPEICGGACRAATCLPADQVTRNPDSCECCARNGQQTDGALPCCSERVHVVDYGPLGRAYYCASRGAGEACSFNAQCYSNLCLCGAFGCGCQ